MVDRCSIGVRSMLDRGDFGYMLDCVSIGFDGCSTDVRYTFDRSMFDRCSIHVRPMLDLCSIEVQYMLD